MLYAEIFGGRGKKGRETSQVAVSQVRLRDAEFSNHRGVTENTSPHNAYAEVLIETLSLHIHV